MIIVVEYQDGKRDILTRVRTVYNLSPIATRGNIKGRPIKRVEGVTCPKCGEQECVNAGWRYKCQNCKKFFPKKPVI